MSGKKLWGPVLLVVLVCVTGLVVATSASAAALSFAPARHFAAGPGPVALVAGDLNGDGRPDLVTANSRGDSIRVMLGNGRGGFAGGPLSRFATGAGPASLALADFNGDGKLDVVTGNGTDATISVLLGGGGGFATRADFAVGPAPLSPSPMVVAVGDFNGDGHPDVASALGTRALVLLGNGKGGLSKPVPFPVGAHPVRLAAADFNGDRMLDLATADYAENSVSVLLNGPRAAPVLRDLTPCQGRVGAVITLTGARFGASRGASVVRFGAMTAVGYAAWSATKIKVRVPPGTAKGWVKVTVRTVAGRSVAKFLRRL